MTRLTELNPGWVSYGGPIDEVWKTGPDGEKIEIPYRGMIGVAFDCPCGSCGERAYIPFSNPIDGGPPVDPDRPHWQREGENFKVMTLSPSIQRMGGCRWHGHLVRGEFVPC